MVTIFVAAHDLDVALTAYIDSCRLLVVSGHGSDFGKRLWIGVAETPLEMVAGQADPHNVNHGGARSAYTVQRAINSPAGNLLHLSRRKKEWESYIWQDKADGSKRTLTVCRTQDFDFSQEGASLTVRPKARTIYCAGINQASQITLVTTVQDHPESAEVFTGPSLTSLQRRMVRRSESYPSRIEMRVGNSILSCSPDGMHWSPVQAPSRESLRMLPNTLSLEINHQTGTAQLVTP